MAFAPLAREVAPAGVAHRRWLHAHPELSFQERETAAYVAARLTELGIPHRTGVGGYGVRAVIAGRPGRTIALRADMDALPIQEETGLPFASTVPGVMHACGHDFHTAALLATGQALWQIRDRLPGTVVLIFQPAEETPPGGADAMIRAGVLDGVDAIFGLHVDPFKPAGHFSFTAGPLNAAADTFDLTVLGRGGHGAAPHQAVDAVFVGALVVVGLQAIHSRMTNPLDPLVISVGALTAGSKHNIIAAEARLQGTVRTLSRELWQQVPEQMEQVIAGITAAYGARYRFDYQRGYPVLVNDPAMAELARIAAEGAVGAAAVAPGQPGMYGEDFARYLEHRPGCFGSIGVAAPGDPEPYPCHHGKLKVADELAMPAAVHFYLELVRRYLGA